MAKEEESGQEKSKMINKRTSMKYRSLRQNNEPAVKCLLNLAIILANIEWCDGMNHRCLNPSDIARISEITHKFVGCTPCPPCPPSKEYSIPCGTKAYAGTKSECIPCPSGKFSDGFNTKPCVSCTLCTNKVVKQNCTHSRNSVCGDCKPGYYLENPLFGCIKCTKCCHDGQDQIHPSCSAFHLCKPRPSGCPAVPTTKVPSTSFISTPSPSSVQHNQTIRSLPNVKSAITIPEVTENLRSINSSDTGQSDVGVVGTTRPGDNIPSPVHAEQSTQNNKFSNTVNNPWFIISLVFIFAAVIVSVTITAIKLKKRKKLNKDASSVMEAGAKYELVSQDPNAQSNKNSTSTTVGTAECELVSQDPNAQSNKNSTSTTVGTAECELVSQDPNAQSNKNSTSTTVGTAECELVSQDPNAQSNKNSTSTTVGTAECELVSQDPIAQSNKNSTSTTVGTAECELVSQDPIAQSNNNNCTNTSTGLGSVEYELLDPTSQSSNVTSSPVVKEHINQDPSRSQIEEREGFSKKTLQQFSHKNFDVVDTLSKLLYRVNQGLFDFERVALVWELEEEDVFAIKAEIYSNDGSPVRKLLGVLCAWKPHITVEELADSIKKINSKAYEILKPHFMTPTEEKDRIVD